MVSSNYFLTFKKLYINNIEYSYVGNYFNISCEEFINLRCLFVWRLNDNEITTELIRVLSKGMIEV